MSWAAVAAAAIGAVGSIASANQQSQGNKSVANSISQIGQDGQLNIDDLIARSENQAERQIQLGQALEQQYDPQLAALRDVVGSKQLASAQDTDLERLIQEARNAYFTGEGGANFGNELSVDPLVTQALQGYGQDLAMGGNLPREIQNLVARAAAGQASQSGTLGTQMGRDLAARDLGLTALDIRNSRMANALNAGQVGTNLNQNINAFNAQLRQAQKAQNLQTLSFLEGLGQQRTANEMALTSQPLPTATIDPASLADIIVSDINSQRQLQATKLASQAQLAQQNASNKAGLTGDLAGIAANLPWGSWFGGGGG